MVPFSLSVNFFQLNDILFLLPKKESSKSFTNSSGMVYLLDDLVAEFLDPLYYGVAIFVEGSLELGIIVYDLIEKPGRIVVDDVVLISQLILSRNTICRPTRNS